MPDNQQMVANLFNEMEDQIFLGDRLAKGEFATLQRPGQFVSTKLSEKAGSADMYTQFELVDSLLDSSFIKTELAGSLSHKYKEILEFAALPKKSATSAEEQEIADIRDWVEKHSQAYDQYSERFDLADKAWLQEANKPEADPATLNSLKRKRDKASSDWVVFGFKKDYENRKATLSYILQGYPQSFWADIQTKFGSPQASPKGDYYPTFFYPPASTWSDPLTSWSTFSRTIDDSKSHAVSRSTSWSAGGGFGFGLWSFGASASRSTQYNHTDSDASHVDLSFDFLRVRIQRPWFSPDVLGYRWWTWKKSHGPAVFSDGGDVAANPPIRPLGQMPVVPTHFILVRNVRISANFTHNDQTFVASQFSSGASFGWGPFSVSGSYSESNSDQQVNAHFDGATFTIAQPQIIAYTGFLVPHCPNPIPQLPWGEDAYVPETPHSLNSPQLDRARLGDLAALRAERQKMQLVQRVAAERALEDAANSKRVREFFSEALAMGMKSRRMTPA